MSGGFEPPCFICHLNVFSSYKNCSKDPNLQTSTPDSKSMLKKYIQIGPVLTVYRFRTEVNFGVLSPHISSFILMFFLGTQIVPMKLPFKLLLRFKILHLIEMTGAKYLSIPPHFCENAPFPTLLMVLWKTYSLI